jgi:hypothetical protein
MEYSDSRSSRVSPFGFVNRIRLNPGVIFALIIITALLAFEMFNYSTTDYALRDLLGDLKFAGMPWATILAVAFCGIDFAGIARLFTPEQGIEEPKEVWYLFGAWLMAATMNAILTWWGVSMAVVNHNVQSTAVMDASTLVHVVPVFVALMVWVIRILIIGSLSVAGDRLVWGSKHRRASNNTYRPAPQPQASHRPSQMPVSAAPRPVARSMEASPARVESSYASPRQNAPLRSEPARGELTRGEPSYHSLSASAPRPAPKPISAPGSGDPGARQM